MGWAVARAVTITRTGAPSCHHCRRSTSRAGPCPAGEVAVGVQQLCEP